MKVVILAGGFGSRISEYTEAIPKPMITIGDKPILHHIIEIYNKYNFFDFYLTLGYKKEIVENYFLDSKNLVKIADMDDNYKVIKFKINHRIINITMVDTGLNTMTGGRIKRIKHFLKNETFMLTYGDGLCNLNLSDLHSFHTNHGKLVTVTAVRPPARFGALKIKDDKVLNFQEKSKLNEGWINGGFFVVQPDFINFIKDDSTVLERFPLENASNTDQLRAFKHDGFWQCMDTRRDKDILEKIYNEGIHEW